MQNLVKTLLLTLLMALVLSGCSNTLPSRPKVYWPPVEPRMEWITTYASEDSFIKTPGQISAEKFLGKAAVHKFGKPVFAASRGDGIVYVSDMDYGEIRVINFNNKTTKPLADESPVGRPIGLAFDSKGHLFVADALRKSIVEINTRHETVRNFGVEVLERPTYLALDEAHGRIYVTDVVKHEVIVFDLISGKMLFSFDGSDGPVGKIFGPQGIAVDSKGRVFVAEQLHARIQVFDREGKSLYAFGVRGDQEFELEGPRGLAFDHNDNLFVADVRKAALLVFTPEGKPLTSIRSDQHLHPLGFAMPSGVYVDPNDRIYIGDGMNRRFTVWQMLTPGYLAEHPIDEASVNKVKEDLQKLEKTQ